MDATVSTDADDERLTEALHVHEGNDSLSASVSHRHSEDFVSFSFCVMGMLLCVGLLMFCAVVRPYLIASQERVVSDVV